MLNEHHNAPFCMQAKCNIFASILAAVTKRVKIVLLGNPLPLADNPVRLAEELAMIDMISKGRAGLRLRARRRAGAARHRRQPGLQPRALRGGARPDRAARGPQPGPFRWEGTHYQHRVVNPWAVPLQKPHPRVWIPGVLSKETIIWAAQQRYPYIALNTAIDATKKIWELYDEVAAEAGYTGGPGEPRLPAALPRRRHRGEGARRTRGSSCGCRASSPASRIRCGRARRATSRRRTAAPSSSSRSGRRRTRAAADLRGADRRPHDHRRHAEDGASPSCAALLEETRPSHPGLLGQRRLREQRRRDAPASGCSARR